MQDLPLKGPFFDPLVHRPYDADSIGERVFNKLWMQDCHGFALGERIPVLGCIAPVLRREEAAALLRLMPAFFHQGVQLLVCAHGAASLLEALKRGFPAQVDFVEYTPRGRAEVLSGGDILLARSEEERRIAMAYGMAVAAPEQEEIAALLMRYQDAEAWEDLQSESMKRAAAIE